MQSVGMVVAGALLFALLLLIAAVLLWQEVRKGTFRNPSTYVLEEAVPFVFVRLPEEVRTRLTQDDVRRMLEWAASYLQRTPGGVAGGDGATAHVVERAREVQGVEYAREDVRVVLEADAAYWEAIGALGDPVEATLPPSAEGRPTMATPAGGGPPEEDGRPQADREEVKG